MYNVCQIFLMEFYVHIYRLDSLMALGIIFSNPIISLGIEDRPARSNKISLVFPELPVCFDSDADTDEMLASDREITVFSEWCSMPECAGKQGCGNLVSKCHGYRDLGDLSLALGNLGIMHLH